MSKRGFKEVDAKCIHVTIEAVFDLNELGDMEDTLEQLQQYGAAVVTKRKLIAEPFDQAAKILQERKA